MNSFTQRCLAWSIIAALLPASLVAGEGETGYFRIELTDKEHSPYTIENPENYLSERAIERRVKNNVEIEWADLPVSPAYIDSLRSDGARIKYPSRWFNYVIAYIEDPAIYQQISERGFVNQLVMVKPKPDDDDDDGSLPGGSAPKKLTGTISNSAEAFYGDSYLQINQLAGEFLHKKNHTGSGKIIAVLDAGFPFVDHYEAFAHIFEEGRLLANYDFVRDTANAWDQHIHGMAVLSVMGGLLEGKLVGTAPDASYIVLRTEDAATEYRIEEHNWIAAAEFADSAGADIINSSLGYTTFDDTAMNYKPDDLDGETIWVTRGANMAASRGVLVFNAAGNSGRLPWQTMVAPADGFEVISVGGINRENELYIESSTGFSADGRVKPDVAALAHHTTIASANDGEIARSSGTSFASPVTAGLAASLWSAFPDETAQRIREAILKSSHLYNNPNGEMGYGIPDFFWAYHYLNGATPADDFELLTGFPNPFIQEIRLLLNIGNVDQLNLQLTDVQGRQVANQNHELSANSFNDIVIDNLDAIPPGMYILQLQTSNQTSRKKFLKN